MRDQSAHHQTPPRVSFLTKNTPKNTQKKMTIQTRTTDNNKWPLLLFIICFIYLIHFTTATITTDSGIEASEDDSFKYHVLIRDSLDLSVRDSYSSSHIIPMTIRGELYTCFIPVSSSQNTSPQQQQQQDNMAETTTEASSTTTTEQQQQQLRALLKQYEKKCFYRMTGWWIYEFCFNTHIRQYHQDPKTSQVTMNYFLGYAKEQTMDQLAYTVHMSPSDPEESYVSFQYLDGTECDLTGQLRKTEVRLYCATDVKRQQLLVNTNGILTQTKMNNFIGDIEEPASCSYIVKFYSSQLCEHQGFAKVGDKVHKIQCIPHEQAQAILSTM